MVLISIVFITVMAAKTRTLLICGSSSTYDWNFYLKLSSEHSIQRKDRSVSVKQWRMLRLQLLQSFWALPLLLLHRVRSAKRIITFVRKPVPVWDSEAGALCPSAEGSPQVCRVVHFFNTGVALLQLLCKKKKKRLWCFFPCISSARIVWWFGS